MVHSRPGYFFPAYFVVIEVDEYVHLSEERMISQLHCVRVIVVGQNVPYLRTATITANSYSAKTSINVMRVGSINFNTLSASLNRTV